MRLYQIAAIMLMTLFAGSLTYAADSGSSTGSAPVSWDQFLSTHRHLSTRDAFRAYQDYIRIGEAVPRPTLGAEQARVEAADESGFEAFLNANRHLSTKEAYRVYMENLRNPVEPKAHAAEAPDNESGFKAFQNANRHLSTKEAYRKYEESLR